MVLIPMLAAGMLIGLWLLLRPAAGPGGGRGQPAARARLTAPRWIERRIYRHHRVAGGVLAGLAWLVLGWLQFGLDRAAVLAALGGGMPATVALPVAVFVIWLGSLAGLVAGVLMLLRPSALKPVEAVANRWITVAPRLGPVGGWQRLLGAVIASACAGALWVVAVRDLIAL